MKIKSDGELLYFNEVPDKIIIKVLTIGPYIKRAFRLSFQ